MDGWVDGEVETEGNWGGVTETEKILWGIQLCTDSVVVLLLLFVVVSRHQVGTVSVCRVFCRMVLLYYPPPNDCYYSEAGTRVIIPRGSLQKDNWRRSPGVDGVLFAERRQLSATDDDLLMSWKLETATTVQIIKIIISLQLSQS